MRTSRFARWLISGALVAAAAVAAHGGQPVESDTGVKALFFESALDDTATAESPAEVADDGAQQQQPMTTNAFEWT